MKPTIRAVRAVAAEFARRKAQPIIAVGAVAALVLVAVGVWLVTLSAWWWLLLVPVLVLATIFAVLSVAVWVVLKIIDSTETREQRRAVADYSSKLERVADSVQTPYWMILLRVAYDVLWPRDDGFVATMSRDTKTLAPEFVKLVQSFMKL